MKRYKLGNPVLVEFYKCSDVDDEIQRLERYEDWMEENAYSSYSMLQGQDAINKKGQDND